MVVVRQALTGLAACLSLDALETNDLNTAVTEACNNVVLHAYGGSEGPLQVDVRVSGPMMEIWVRDEGRGIGHYAHALPPDGAVVRDSSPSGMGLAVIDALAHHVEFHEPSGGGTEVFMRFPAPAGASLEPVGQLPEDEMITTGEGGVTLAVAPKELTRAVLPRVLSALAARAHFTTDRISDVQMVADVLAANVDESVGGDHLQVDVTVQPRALELRIGPLSRERGERLVEAAADGMAPVIDRLADLKRVSPADGELEMLELRVVDRR